MGLEPLVSVVTPFYDTQEFLRECIESVLRQTYQNWEYVLVDNCSTDGSSEIAAHYACRFPRKIRLIHTKSFLSQVQNYNFALSCISPDSKYCKMVQADDWIFPDCIRSMVELAEAHPSIGIVSAYKLEGDRAWLGNGLSYPSPEVPGREICRRYFQRYLLVFGTPTSLLFRSDVVRSRNPFYDDRRAPFEDFHVCFDVLLNCNFGFVHQVLTYTRMDNESMLSQFRPHEFEFFARLSAIVVHGRKYLSEEEYDRILEIAERAYFLFLGDAALRFKQHEFWEFHRKSLASIGYSLDFKFMAKWVLTALFDYIGNPKRTLEFLWQRRRRILAPGYRFIGASRRAFVRRQGWQKS